MKGPDDLSYRSVNDSEGTRRASRRLTRLSKRLGLTLEQYFRADERASAWSVGEQVVQMDNLRILRNGRLWQAHSRDR